MTTVKRQRFQQFGGASALLAAAGIYATFGLLIREISKMMNGTTQTFVRFLLAAAIIAVVNLLARKRFSLPLRAALRAGLLGVLFCGVVLLFTISVTTTKIANSVFLLYAGSIVTSFLIGTFVLKEAVTKQKIIAIIIAMAGLAMYSGELFALSVGVLAGVGSGLLDGVANAARKTLKAYDRNTIVMYHYAIGGIVALGIALTTTGIGFGPFAFGPAIATLVFAVLMLVLSNLLLYGFQHFDVNVGTVILATELVFATLLGYIFFRELPTQHELMGGILIFAASLTASIDFSKPLALKAALSRKAKA